MPKQLTVHCTKWKWLNILVRIHKSSRLYVNKYFYGAYYVICVEFQSIHVKQWTLNTHGLETMKIKQYKCIGCTVYRRTHVFDIFYMVKLGYFCMFTRAKRQRVGIGMPHTIGSFVSLRYFSLHSLQSWVLSLLLFLLLYIVRFFYLIFRSGFTIHRCTFFVCISPLIWLIPSYVQRFVFFFWKRREWRWWETKNTRAKRKRERSKNWRFFK